MSEVCMHKDLIHWGENAKNEMKKNEEKRKKFHDVLLNLYHPPPPPPPPPPSSSTKQCDEETSGLINEDLNFDFHPVSVDEVEEENCGSNASDCEPKKLTRAQRKRIRKRKLKEAAPVRRKIVGPMFPSDYHNSAEEHCGEKMKTFQENNHSHTQDAS